MMLDAIVTAGATTLVAAMATDAWQSARSGVARLFGGRDRAQEAIVEAQLDSNAALVAAAEDTEQARHVLIPMWQLQLGQLLQQDPEAADELQRLVDQIRGALPQAQKDWAQKVQNVVVHDGEAFIVQDGNLHVYQGPPSQQRPLTSEGAEDAGGT
jgi:mannose-6-phosphate isomerase class I